MRVSAPAAHAALVRKLHGIWNGDDVDDLGSVYASDFVAHFPASSEIPERRGIDGVRMGIARIRTAFPDWHEEVKDLLVDGDRVATRYISTGTHLGPFWGITATGRRVEVQEMSVYRIANGRIVEQWCLVDELARILQLGATLRRPSV